MGWGWQGLITLHFFLQKCKEGKLFKFGSLVNLMQLWSYQRSHGGPEILRVHMPYPQLILPNQGFLSMLQEAPDEAVVSGATLGITDKMEARPQTPLLIPQAWPRDEGVRPCNSDLSFTLLSWVDWKGILKCLLFLRGAWEGTKPSSAVLRK